MGRGEARSLILGNSGRRTEEGSGKQTPGDVSFEDVLNKDTVDLKQRGIYLSFRRETLEHVCVWMKIIQEREKNKQTR